MSMSVDQLVQRQNEILKAMSEIRTMQRGTVSRQHYPERAQRKEGQGAVGPYCLWQGTVNGTRFAKRVSGPQAERVEQGITQRHAFEALCEEYVAISCELAQLEAQGDQQAQAVKKTLASPWKRTAK